jgi:5-aminolevulinate synthase
LNINYLPEKFALTNTFQMMTEKEVRALDYTEILANRLDTLKQQGNYRYFLPLDKKAELLPEFTQSRAHSEISGTDEDKKRGFINWTSNDYIGMSANKSVIKAFVEAAKTDGVGSGGTRNISGTTGRHILLERTIADLHQKQAALLFTSAYVANSTAISILGRAFPNTLIISDAENHASMIEGIKLSRCEKVIFRHNDIKHLEQILAKTDIKRPKIIVFESVYSMSGTIAPITEIITLAKKYKAFTYLDEVHAVGLYGKNGEGIAGQMNCAHDIDVINGTLAKAYGCIGGYIAGNSTIVDYVRSFGEGFIFTSSLPPALCAAATESILYVKNNPKQRAKFHKNVQILRGIFKKEGIDFDDNPSHITRIIIGDAKRSKMIADRLLNEFGIYLQPINYPSVLKGHEGLRIVCTAKHTKIHIEALAKALSHVLT